MFPDGESAKETPKPPQVQKDTLVFRLCISMHLSGVASEQYSPEMGWHSHSEHGKLEGEKLDKWVAAGWTSHEPLLAIGAFAKGGKGTEWREWRRFKVEERRGAMVESTSPRHGLLGIMYTRSPVIWVSLPIPIIQRQMTRMPSPTYHRWGRLRRTYVQCGSNSESYQLHIMYIHGVFS